MWSFFFTTREGSMSVSILEAQNLMRKLSTGVLSTNSKEMEGYPFGSLTPYSLDEKNNPIIYISSIAQHTKNIEANNKLCLTIVEETIDEDKQAHARVSLLALAEKITSDSKDYTSISQSYFDKFPKSTEYKSTHDFSFYRLNVKRVRYIAGFGKITWIEKDK
jgi:putative heme iron utilization protein